MKGQKNLCKTDFATMRKNFPVMVILIFVLCVHGIWAESLTSSDKDNQTHQRLERNLKILKTFSEHFGLRLFDGNLQEYVQKESGQEKDLLSLAKFLNFKATIKTCRFDDLKKIGMPIIVELSDGDYVVVEYVGANRILAVDSKGTFSKWTREEFMEKWSGKVILLEPPQRRQSLSGDEIRLSYSELVYNFGECSNLDTITHDFKVYNNTDVPIEMNRIAFSCECTVTSSSREVYKPGERGIIGVSFDPYLESGLVTQEINIHYFAPEPTRDTLLLRGSIVPELVYAPRSMYFGSLQRGEKKKMEVLVKDFSENGKLKILSAKTDFPHVKVSVAKVRDEELNKGAFAKTKATGGFRISLALDTTSMDIEKVKDSLTIRTNNPKAEKIEIPIEAKIFGDLRISPPRLFFGFMERDSKTQKTLRLLSNSGEDFNLKSINVGNLPVEIKVEKQSNHEYALNCECEISADFSQKNVSGTVRIITDHPTQPEVEIPVFAIIKNGERSR
jgi:hypothetical protein